MANDQAAGKSGSPEGGRLTLVGESAALEDVRARIERLGPAGVPVLIQGETGTGKELVARLLHARSGRAPFVPVNCSALHGTLFESELFGHEKGAFTGADRTRPGLTEHADGGTLFLDEVGDLSPSLQPKLLRMLEEGRVRRVGSNDPRPVDVRVICATNRDVATQMAEGGFRGDLYYRIAHGTIRLPPLRDRPEDLRPLLRHLFGVVPWGPGTLECLSAHSCPGNIRELKAVVEVALAYADGGPILPEHLEFQKGGPRSAGLSAQFVRAVGSELRPLRQAVAEFERAYVQRVVEAVGGNKTRAAELLGVDRKTVRRKLQAAS